MNRNTTQPSAGQIIGLIDGQQVVGLDIAKNVFQRGRAGFTPPLHNHAAWFG